MSSSEVVNILQNLTFRNFPDFFVGGSDCRPLILRLAAHSAARQTEVRIFYDFLVFALPKKEFLLFGLTWYNEIVLNEPTNFLMAVFGQSNSLG